MHSRSTGTSNLVKIPAFGFIRKASGLALDTMNNEAERKGAFAHSGLCLCIIWAICILPVASLCHLSQWQMGLQEHPYYQRVFRPESLIGFRLSCWVTRISSNIRFEETQGLTCELQVGKSPSLNLSLAMNSPDGPQQNLHTLTVSLQNRDDDHNSLPYRNGEWLLRPFTWAALGAYKKC